MSTKLQFVQTVVMMLYGGETWSLLEQASQCSICFSHALFNAGLWHLNERPRYKARHVEAV